MLAATFLSALALAGSPGVLLAAGDIAACTSPGDEATAALIGRLRGTVAALGDNVYERGTPEEFARCYQPSWGRFKPRTRPAAGNHEYETPGASGYYAYFGRRAGRPGRGFYAYRLGTWRIIVLNSNCAHIGGCGPGSAQERWLRAELRAHPTHCTLAYWHHPRFSSGLHGDDPAVGPLWDALHAAGAEVILTGHDHDYERFAPLTPAGRVDRLRGIRQFVVGTGGRSLRPFVRKAAGSQVRNAGTFGVLKLTLRNDRYDWRFLPVAGGRFSDSGSSRCH